MLTKSEGSQCGTIGDKCVLHDRTVYAQGINIGAGIAQPTYGHGLQYLRPVSSDCFVRQLLATALRRGRFVRTRRGPPRHLPVPTNGHCRLPHAGRGGRSAQRERECSSAAEPETHSAAASPRPEVGAPAPRQDYPQRALTGPLTPIAHAAGVRRTNRNQPSSRDGNRASWTRSSRAGRDVSSRTVERSPALNGASIRLPAALFPRSRGAVDAPTNHIFFFFFFL